MARLFAAASSQYLNRTSAPVTALPMTLHCRARIDTLPSAPWILNLTEIGNDNLWVAIAPSAGGVFRALHKDGTVSTVATHGVTATLGQWYATTAVFASAASRSIYVDGVGKVTDTTNAPGSIANLGQVNVGAYVGLAVSNYLDGAIADVAIWDVALDDDEVAALGKGVSPLLIRPQNLKAYWPLFGVADPEPGRWKDTLTLTLFNAPTKADHPRSFAPTISQYAHTPTSQNLATAVVDSVLFTGSATLLPGPRPLVGHYLLDGVNISNRVLLGDSIDDVINDSPSKANLTLIGPGFTPEVGMVLRIALDDGNRVLFNGQLQVVGESYQEILANKIWECEALDDTAQANYKRPFARYVNQSVSTIALDYISRFAPGFTAAVQTGLDPVSINYDGSETFIGGLTRLAQTIGGYCKVEEGVVSLFLTDAVNAPDNVVDGSFENDPPMKVSRDETQLRTRVFGRGYGESIKSDLIAGETIIPIDNGTMFTDGGGKAIMNVVPNEATFKRIAYGDVIIPTAISLVGTGIGPGGPPGWDLIAGAGATTGRHFLTVVFKSAAGRSLPSSPRTIDVGFVLPATTAPTAGAPIFGGGPDPGSHYYAVTRVTAAGETPPSPVSGNVVTSAETIADPTTVPTLANGANLGYGSLTNGNSYKIKYAYADAAGRETLPTAATGLLTINASQRIEISGVPYSTDSDTASIFFYISENGGAGTFKRVNIGIIGSAGQLASWPNNYGTGTFNVEISLNTPLTPNAPTVNSTGLRTVPLTGIPGSGGWGLVLSQNVYGTAAGGSQLKLIANIGANANAYNVTTPDSGLGANAPTVNTAAANQIALSVIATGPSGTTDREIYMSPVDGGTRRLALTVAGNVTTTGTVTMSDATLASQIAEPTSDTSGFTQPTGQIQAGATTMPLATVGFPSAGWAEVNGIVFRYTGVTAMTVTGIPATGPGSLTGPVSFNSNVRALPILTDVSVLPDDENGIALMSLDVAVARDSAVHIFVQEDDEAAQTAKIARDNGGDGIVEWHVSDERRNEVTLRQLCRANLIVYSMPIVTVDYDSRDVKNKSGKSVVYNVSVPFLNETLVIQSVSISEIDHAKGILAPRFSISASNMRFSVEDQLRRLGI